jgi:hypothetical protein
MSNVIAHQLIAAERRRQIESEGWSPDLMIKLGSPHWKRPLTATAMQ